MNRYVLTILFVVLFPAGLAFGSITPAESVEESKNLLADRKAGLLSYWADQELPEWQGWESEGSWLAKPSGPAKVHFPNIALAKLALGDDTDEVNDALINAQAYSGVGSHVPLLRAGDYDFPLFILTAITYEVWDDHNLATTTKTHLAKSMLNQEGSPQSPEHVYGFFPETENHVLMTEISRYLKNQLVENRGMEYRATDLPASAYDNKINGMRDFLLGYLKEIIAGNFDEYNSKPYEVYTLSAIQTLYEYAEDPDVKLAAKNVLDYHALRYALQSMDLRRVVPFRRQAKHIELDHVYERDAGAARYAMLVGNHVPVSETRNRALQSRARTSLAVGDYEVPDTIKDLMISSADTSYLYWSFYDNAEIVHRDVNFLISAGGIHHDKTRLPFFSHMDGLPRETVVMFKGGSPLISDMIRFEGARDITDKNNTCVFAHFACGLYPHLPEKVKEEASNFITSGPWTYLNVHNSYVAFYHNQDLATGDAFGFLEVVDSDTFPSLAAFKSSVEDRNEDREYSVGDDNAYITSAGVEITFRLHSEDKSSIFVKAAGLFGEDDLSWAIKDVQNSDIKMYPQEDLREWPALKAVDLRTGSVIAEADGDVTIDNPRHQPPLSFGITTDTAYRHHSTSTKPAGNFWSE